MISYVDGSIYPGNEELFLDVKSSVRSGLSDGNLKMSSRLLPSCLATSSSAAAPDITSGASYHGSRWCWITYIYNLNSYLI